jgi:hypothetical protein
VFGHLIPSMQAEAAQKIDELITPVEILAELNRTVGANVKENRIITAPRSLRRVKKPENHPPYIDNKGDSARNLPYLVAPQAGLEPTTA